MIYIALVASLPIMAYLCFSKNGILVLDRKQGLYGENHSYLMLFFILCAILIAFRSNLVGVDTIHYSKHFDTVSTLSFSEIRDYSNRYAIEIGYIFLMKLSSLIIDNYYFFQLIIASLYSLLMYRFFSKNTDNQLFVSVLFLGLGLLLYSFNIQRQMLAVAIVLESWNAFTDKKYYRTVFWLILASFFHSTAVIFLGVLLSYYFRESKLFLILSSIVILFVVIRFDFIINLLSHNISKYANYFKNIKVIQSAGGVKFIWGGIVLLALLTIFRKIFLQKKELSNLPTYAILSLGYVVANILGLHFNYFERLGLYCLPFVAIFLEKFGTSLEDKTARSIYYFFTYLFFIIYFLMSAMGSKQYNYHFYF